MYGKWEVCGQKVMFGMVSQGFKLLQKADSCEPPFFFPTADSCERNKLAKCPGMQNTKLCKCLPQKWGWWALNLWRASKWHPKSYISNLLVCTQRALFQAIAFGDHMEYTKPRRFSSRTQPRPGHELSMVIGRVLGDQILELKNTMSKLKRYILTFWKVAKFHSLACLSSVSQPYFYHVIWHSTQIQQKNQDRMKLPVAQLMRSEPQTLVTFRTGRTGTTLEWILAKMSIVVPQKRFEVKSENIWEIFSNCICFPLNGK